MVDARSFDQRALRDWLGAQVARITADTWPEVAAKVSRLGSWEFEEYQA